MASAGAVSLDVRDVLENFLENVQLFLKQIKGETGSCVMYMTFAAAFLCQWSLLTSHFDSLAMHAGDTLPVKPRVVDGKAYWKAFGKRFVRSSVVNSQAVVC